MYNTNCQFEKNIEEQYTIFFKFAIMFIRKIKKFGHIPFFAEMFIVYYVEIRNRNIQTKPRYRELNIKFY